ncbi:MAG: valine--tRNA ligase [Bacteroidota bacterium]
MSTLSTKYDPSQIEDKWYAAWLEANLFHSEPDERPAYSIVIPPPNVTGILHMGHVLDNTLQDVLIRRKRMTGFNTCWVPGTDHASIATESKVVAKLAEEGIRKEDIGREKYLEHAYAWKDKYGGIILHQLKKLGCSCDWDRTNFTMNPDYSKAVLEVFCKLFEKGLIYRGIRMVNWDPKAQTAISDEEVNYKSIQGKLYHIRYPIEGMEDSYAIVATTRPETLLGDTAVAINPVDDRWAHLKGKQAIVPLVGRPVPIIEDEYVKTDFGTGCLKVTPAHDINDYELGIKHGLDSIDIFSDDGTINESGDLYLGQDRFAVRKEIVKDLEEAGLLVKIEPYAHEVGHSERTDVPIEPKLSMQWFLKMEELVKPALNAVNEGDIKLIPGRFINTYRHWLENIQDWCLSRQLWWGHQIPAYYLKGGNDYVVASSLEEALEEAQKKTGDSSLTAKDLTQDPDVLDTWASSWLWPIEVFKGLSEPGNPDITYYYPTQTLVTGPDIIFFWVARMIMAGYEIMGEKPFEDVYLHGLVRDKKRRKMSKSLGNSPDALKLIDDFGADGVRMGMLLSAPAGNDILFDESLVEQGRNFCNKIWNSLRLVKGWELSDVPASDQDQMAIKWMQARIDAESLVINDHFEKYRLSDALMACFKLIRDEFSQWYLEMVKPPYGEPISRETWEATISFFEQVLECLHPFMPFITEEVWQQLRDRKEGDFIVLQQQKKPSEVMHPILEEFELIKELVTKIRAFRVENGFSPKEQISLFLKTKDEERFIPYTSLLEKFLNTDTIAFVKEQVENSGSLRVQTHECFIPLKAVDTEAEREKLKKEIQYYEGFLQKTEKKLSNEKFVANAPEKVVALERKKLADTQEKLNVLRESLLQLN